MISTNKSRLLMCRVVIAAGVLCVAAGISYSGDAPPADWKAPAEAASKQNPVPAGDGSIAAGKKAYLGNCLACHGVGGKGDGPAAAAISPPPRDLADPNISSQTDGALFWKITTGRKPMPHFDQTLTDENRWNVVNYVRTLEPRAAAGK
jgi:mono/diheme cytochrome c family protein